MSFNRDTYYQDDFRNLAILNETIKSIEFEECKFTGCSFIDCAFEKCKFISCTFNDCILSAVNPMNCNFSEVKFSGCKAIGCDWTKTSQIQELEFTNCQINYSNFAMLKIPKTKMMNCQAKEVDFTETDLSEGIFSGADFERSIFSRTNLTKADLRGAVNYHIDPRYNTIKQARFSLPEVLSLLACLDIVID